MLHSILFRPQGCRTLWTSDVSASCAGEAGLAQHNRREGCCNAQWVLFGFGWVCGLTWILGFLLPMCSYQRLKVPSYR